jgi:tetratricopeptide (TPR) repeat protein
MTFKNNGKYYFKTNSILITLASGFFLSSIYLNHITEPPKFEVSKQLSAINIKNTFIRLFAIGNKRLISNVLWTQTLLESDLEHYNKRDLNSWMYLRFSAIADLEPNFYQNYHYGGLFLGIVKDDLEGAVDLYERGLKIFPNDYWLRYNAGFTYYFEMGDFKKGYFHLRQLLNHPEAPEFIKFIIHKLKFENDKDFESAIVLLKHNLSITRDPIIQKKLKAELYALTAEKDLLCLNSKLKNCSLRDIDGKPYIFRDGKWVAAQKFRLYRINVRKKKGA